MWFLPHLIFFLPCGADRCWLFEGNRIGRRKSILERIVERLFKVPTRAANTIIIALVIFPFRIGIHFYNFDQAAQDCG
jgi:hypothetical protein